MGLRQPASIVLPAFVAALALAGATAAKADTYCVPAKTIDGCASADTSTATLQAALDLAGGHAGSDRILIGPGCPGCKLAGGTYSSTEPLQIVGAGIGRTVLGNSPDPVLSLADNASVTVSDLTIAVPSGFAGLDLNGARAERVAIVGDADAASSVGAALDGGSFTNGSIALAAADGFDNVGLRTDGGVVQRSTIRAGTGIWARLGSTNVANVLIDLRGAAANATALSAYNPDHATAALALNADHLTVVGDGDGQRGASVNADTPNQTATLALTNSILSGVGHPLNRVASAGTANFVSDYSNYDLSGNIDLKTGGLGATIETNHRDADPAFVDPANNDFSLGSVSTLIDAGQPAPLPVGEPAVDLNGDVRVLDGNGDCSARQDLGAYEYVPAQVTARLGVSPLTAPAGQPLLLDASGSCDPDPGATLHYSWSFDDGASGSGPLVQHAYTGTGLHSATVTVTSSAGRSGTASAIVTVTAPPPAPAAPAAGRLTAQSVVLIAGKRVRLSRKGVAGIKLHCAGSASCAGLLLLHTARPVAARRPGKKVVRLGLARFTLRPGQTGTVKVRVAKPRLRLVERLHRVPARLTVKDTDSSGRPRSAARLVTLTAPR